MNSSIMKHSKVGSSEHTTLHVQAIMSMMYVCSGYSGEDSGLGGYRVSTLGNGEDVGAWRSQSNTNTHTTMTLGLAHWMTPN